jgi:hypothetical protein
MKEIWSTLHRPRRILLIVNAVMAAAFLLVYLALDGYIFRYQDVLFDVTESDGSYTYSGELEGNDITFTALPDNTFSYFINGKDLGTFTVTLDPTAAPQSDALVSDTVLTGVEIRRDGEVFYRGGFYKHSGGLLMVDQDLSPSSGPKSPDQPSAHTVLFFALFGRAVRHGNWLFFLIALSFAALTFLTSFFPDPFFRAHMALTKDERDHTRVPTYRKVLSWIFWCALTLGALTIFISGMLGF